MPNNDTPAETGHELARRLISPHRQARRRPFPGITDQALKLAAEVGELADAILKHGTGHDGCPSDHYFGGWPDCPHIRKEYGDAGLSLFALGNNHSITLDAAMRQVVAEETQTSAIEEGSG
jgi:NTP pyrophosphatase (non-canonical NTP hydrolase)